MHKTGIGTEKSRLRQMLQQRLREHSPEQRSEMSKKACAALIRTPAFRDSAVIMMYLPMPHEVDTSTAILQAWNLGRTVVVPKISWTQRHMIPVQINSLETGFSTEAHGLRNPVTGLPMPLEEIGVVVTPGLGFDRSGNRLGRGGAYYDRFFDSPGLKAVRCGFAFADQLLDSVPTTENDRSLDMLVTDKEILYFKPSPEVK
ncbi:MAG TPA: 5-formyltetrahydrofolate cyclo-ligase [Sedimentisphaerales bacterium]|nr:5-formyltetrahydrofolate cyclo-ligase [Sedimentisphaerales bacterium]